MRQVNLHPPKPISEASRRKCNTLGKVVGTRIRAVSPTRQKCPIRPAQLPNRIAVRAIRGRSIFFPRQSRQAPSASSLPNFLPFLFPVPPWSIFPKHTFRMFRAETVNRTRVVSRSAIPFALSVNRTWLNSRRGDPRFPKIRLLPVQRAGPIV